MNALREWLDAVRPPASRSQLANVLMGRRDVLATSDPVENARMALPAEPSRYGASLTNRQPDTVDGVQPTFRMPGVPVVTPDQNRRDGMLVDALSGASSSIRAFHGSPHRFDRFSMDRIGTGEGAQAYGHGLYFAGNEEVARSYRDALSAPANPIQRRGVDSAFTGAAESMVGTHTPEQVFDILKSAYRSAPENELRWAVQEAFPKWNPGSMYEVRLNTEPGRLLDWDAPLSGQPAQVRAGVQELVQYQRPAREALERHRSVYGEPTGSHIYNALEGVIPRSSDNMFAGNPSGSRFAAEELRDAGIDGIQYLDQGSRAAGEGSRNYVMFNDAQIEILRRYGILGPTVGAGAAAATTGEQ